MRSIDGEVPAIHPPNQAFRPRNVSGAIFCVRIIARQVKGDSKMGKNEKTKKPKPKYNVWQNTAYMLSVAWDTRRSVPLLVVLLAVALVGVRLVGLNTYVVLSGSMEPTYHTGSLLYVKSVDPQDLRVGDPITFMLNEDTVATHRIIEILPDEEDSSVLRFRTRGDANDAPDGTPVHYKNVIGKPVFSVPYLGYFANFVQNPPGLYFAIGFAVVLVLLVFLPDLLDDSGKKGKGKGVGEEPAAHN